jgi:amino acid adenylation domain-containing protein
MRAPTAVDAARLCHAEVRRLAAGEGVAGTPWLEHVPAPADTPEAAAWRERELGRGVDQAIGPAGREVLLRYADGAADLVTITHRAGDGGPAELADLAAALRRIDAVPAPDWGLGDPAAGDAVGRHEFVLPVWRECDVLTSLVGKCHIVADGEAPTSAAATAATMATEVTVLAALGLVLARYTGHRCVTIGTADPRRWLVLRVDQGSTVQAYLHAVRRALDPITEPAGDPPLVGLAITGVAPMPAGVSARPFLAPVQPLSIHLGGLGGPMLHGTCWFRRRHFDRWVVEQLAGQLATAHRGLVDADPHTPVAEVPLLSAPEQRRLAELGGLGRPLPATLPTAPPAGWTIHGAVAAQAARTPHTTAVCCGDDALTYAELDARANRAANALRAAGVRAGTLVGVCLDRSVELVVALLAVLKAGAAYLPMDPSYPAERLAFTAEDAGLTAMVGAAGGIPGLDGVRVLAPAALTGGDPPATAPADGDGSADDPAYVIYTSGSTGTPKGVVVPHRNVASLLAATRGEFGLGEHDVWTQFHSSAFDFSVWEIWGCLMTGGRLVLVPYWVSRSPEEFAELLATERVTVLSQTPSAFTQLMDVDRWRRLPDSLRLVVLGGEPLDAGPLLSWFDRHPESSCRLVNMFGITETTVHVTAQTVTRADALAASRSVGRPLPGWHVYVLDPDGRQVPAGVAGEIHVGGAGVAASYLNRPELTARRFLPDPFTGGTMYRSGDRGRLLPDGRLVHLGRLDSQVQLRGFRIELDEVRARLLTAPGVAAATVTLHQRGDSATARLAGYVVFRDGHCSRDTDEVRRHAARFLPDHMVPATVTALPALPLTPNGKVDVARLPEPVPALTALTAQTAQPALTAPPASLASPGGDGVTSSPSEPVRQRVLAAWQGVFGFRVGADDDFFALGGNSLLAVRLSAALRAAGLPQVSVRQLYSHRTAARLTAVLREMSGEVRPA